MDTSPETSNHLTNVESVQGPLHSGSGNIYYTTILHSGKKVEIDVKELEKRYFDFLRRAPSLTHIEIPFGSLPMERLYVTPYVAPAAWIIPDGQGIGGGGSAEPALDAIQRFNRSVIFGAPGIGKTTLLKYLTYQIANGRLLDSFPILLSLYDYTTKSDNSDDLIAFAIQETFSHLYQGEELEALQLLLYHWQFEGQLLFLLDGLDEVPLDRQEALLRQVRGLSRFVLTSRPRGRVEVNQEPGATLDLLPLDNQGVARFVRNWAVWKGGDFSADELFSYIRREPRLADLVRIPQLLCIICWLWGEGDTHRYGTKVELLREAVDRLIAKAADLSGIPETVRPIRRRDLRRCLAQTALTMLLEHAMFGLTITLDELLSIFEAESVEAIGELLALARRSGLFVTTTGRGDELRFAHLVFQEYLAAEALVSHPNFESLIDRIKDREHFEECLRMASGLLSERAFRKFWPRLDILLEKLVATDNEDLFRLNWRLAALCLSEVKSPQERWGEQLNLLETTLLSAASEWWARDRFVEAMGRLRTAGMRTKLLAALDAEDGYLRWAAAEALSQMADPSTLDTLVTRIRVETWPPVIGALARALGQIGNPQAIPILQELLVLDGPMPNPFILDGTGEALGRLEATEALGTFLPQAMEDNPDTFWAIASVIMNAVSHLSEESAAALQKKLNAQGFSVRFTPADPYALAGPTFEEIEAALDSEDPEVREEAVLMLGQMPGHTPIYYLLEALLDEDESVTAAAGKALREMDDEGQVFLYAMTIALSMLFEGETEDARLRAAVILSQLWSMPDERTKIEEQVEDLSVTIASFAEGESLETLLSSEEIVVQGTAIWMLGVLGNLEYTGSVIQALNHASDWVRWAAAWALRYLDTSEARTSLLSCLETEEVFEVIEVAIQSAGKLKLSAATPLLLEFLGYEALDSELQVTIIQSLGEIANLESISQLLALLKSASCPVEVQLAAISALRKINSPEAIPALLTLLGGDNIELQVAATEALGDLKAQEAEPFLIHCLSDTDVRLREAAAESLGEIKSKVAIPQLRAMVETDPSDSCRQAAAGALANVADHDTLFALIEALGDEQDLDRLQVIATVLLDRDDPLLQEKLLDRLLAKNVYTRIGSSCQLIIMISEWGTLRQTRGSLQDQLPEDVDPLDYFSEQLQTAEDSTTRWEAANALEALKDPRATVPLMIGLIDPDPWVATASAQTLKELSDDEQIAEDVLIEREKGLAFLKEQQALHYLIENLQLDLDTVNRTTSWALEHILVLCDLIEAYLQGNTALRPILWAIGDKHGLRLMPGGEVILPTGERMPCAAAVNKINY